MIVSMNELDSMTRKAFRGAGYHWGEAEEAGKAAIWLARRGLPALAPILHLLNEAQARLPAMRPQKDAQRIKAAGGLLCPVLAGMALSDAAEELRPARQLQLDPLCAPLLIAPFLAAAAEAIPFRLVISSPAVNIEACGRDCAIQIHSEAAQDGSAILQALDLQSPVHGSITITDHLPTVQPEKWDALSAFAARTYVPATAQSRLSGAGAGLSDQD